MQDAQTQSWSGLGVGTDRESFLKKVVGQLPDYVKGTWLAARRGVDKPY